MSKEGPWSGYYTPYLRRAREGGIEALEILDREWHDGRTTAERDVLPYVRPDSIVLEIACGIGRVARFVAPACRRLVCIDILDEALEEARKNLGAFRNVEFAKTNGYDLGEFEADTFDCVYSFTAFFHFDWELVVGYFAEIRRVLKPGGIGILEFKKWIGKPDIEQLLTKIESAGGVRAYEARLDKWRYASSEMLAVLCDHYGLEVVDDFVPRYTFRKR